MRGSRSACEWLARTPGRSWRHDRSARPRVRDLFRPGRMWRPRLPLRDRYDVVIVGGGSHGLATAYYLAKRGITDVCVLEKGYVGSGAAGRNTAILRPNYRTPEGARCYAQSLR